MRSLRRSSGEGSSSQKRAKSSSRRAPRASHSIFSTVGRPRLAWLLTLPLTAGGSLLAHAASYRIVAPEAEERTELLTASGHGYLAYAAPFLALCLALVLAGAARRTVTAVRGEPALQVSAWPFAVLPPLYFLLQEHLERWMHTGGFPLEAALEPTFVVGLALQLPFALAAFFVARAVLNLADRLGRALASADTPRPTVTTPLVRPPSPNADRPRVPALALGYGERGPPRSF